VTRTTTGTHSCGTHARGTHARDPHPGPFLEVLDLLLDPFLDLPPEDLKKPKKSKEWMSKKPKDGESQTKKVDGKTYHWCEGNGAHKPKWVIHDPKTCNRLKKPKPKDSGSEESKSQPDWEIDQAVMEDDEQGLRQGTYVGPWPSNLPSLRAPLLLIELVLELVGATFGGMMLACICLIYILCHKLVHYTTCTTAGRAVMRLTTSTISSITQHISGNSEKLYTFVALNRIPGLATFKDIASTASLYLCPICTSCEWEARKAITDIVK
jgi:hypothetical protein